MNMGFTTGSFAQSSNKLPKEASLYLNMLGSEALAAHTHTTDSNHSDPACSGMYARSGESAQVSANRRKNDRSATQDGPNLVNIGLDLVEVGRLLA